MVSAESHFEIPEYDEIHLVSQRKYNLDKDRSWWEILYFRFIWLPVVRFGFKRMHIAAPTAMGPDGAIVLIEQQGCYTDPTAAIQACKDEFYSVKKLPLDVALPAESVQYKGHHVPLSVMPDRYRRRVFPLTVAPVRQMAQVKENLENIIKASATSQ